MSERASLACLTACLLLAALVARAPSALSAEGDAAAGNPPGATAPEPSSGAPEADAPAAEPSPNAGAPVPSKDAGVKEPASAAAAEEPRPGPPPLGPGLAGEGDVPSAQPAMELAGGDEPEPPQAPKNLRTIPADEAAGVLGKRVTGAAGEDIGMVVDVLIDTAGKPRAAVVDFGGFLGVGTRKIAVDWTFLQFRPGDRNAPVLIDVSADAIRAAPEYRPSDAQASVVVSPPAENGGGASEAPADAGLGEPTTDTPTAGEPAADGVPAPDVQERAEPPPPSATGQDRPPLPEMKPPNGRPRAHPPPAGLPSTDDLGPAPAPALPQIPPDARQ